MLSALLVEQLQGAISKFVAWIDQYGECCAPLNIWTGIIRQEG